MTFPAMDIVELFTFINECYINRYYDLLILLTDGTTIAGSISEQVLETFQGFEFLEPSIKACFNLDLLKLHSEDSSKIGDQVIYYDVCSFIPIKDISSMFIMDYHTIHFNSVIETESGRRIDVNAEDANQWSILRNNWEQELTRVCADKGYLRIREQKESICLAPQVGIEWEERAHLADGTPLYIDLDYLTFQQGGMTSFGASLGGVSITIGWEGSSAKTASKLLKGNVIDFCDGPNSKNGTVEGYIMICKADSDDLGIRYTRLFEGTESFEGKEWVTGIFSPFPFTSTKELNDRNWCLVYFKKESLKVTEEMFGMIADKVRVFGDFIAIPAKTKYGNTANFRIKARLAATVNESK